MDEPRAAEPAAGKQLEPFKWKPGQSGNPSGRKRGSRNKLGEAFIEALCDDFDQYGVQAIQKVREEDTAAYLRVIAKVVPQEVLIRDARVDDLSDDELTAYLFAIREALAARDEVGRGAPAQVASQPVADISSVHEASAVSRVGRDED